MGDGNGNYPERLKEAVEVHAKALDDLVTVNTLFTVAVFVGLAFANPGQHNIEGNKQCEAEIYVARRLVKNEVISFSFYLLSSLVAKALKTHLFTYLMEPRIDSKKVKSNWNKVLRGSLFALSASASIIAGTLLMYSITDIIQVRLGKVSCKGSHTLGAFGSLIAVNTFALLIYLPFVIHAICYFTKIFDKLPSSEPSAGAKIQG